MLDKTQSIDELSMLVLRSAENLGLPQKSIDVILVFMLKNIGDDTFNLKHKVLSFTSRSWAVEKEVI